jgi:hypothetical protein
MRLDDRDPASADIPTNFGRTELSGLMLHTLPNLVNAPVRDFVSDPRQAGLGRPQLLNDPKQSHRESLSCRNWR